MPIINYIKTDDTYDVQDKRVDPLINVIKKCIIIGDSYADGYTPDGNVTSWSTQLKNALSNKYDEIVTTSLGGVGFIMNISIQKSFKTLLEEVNISDKENVTDIIVCGGWNDTGYSIQVLTEAIQTFMNYAKENFPNAMVTVGMIGCDMNNNEKILSLIDIVTRCYSNVGQFENARFIGNSETILHSREQFSSDRYHPNQTGQNDLFSKILNFIKGGNVENNWGYVPQYAVSNSQPSPNNCVGYINEFSCKGATGFELFAFVFTTPVTMPQGQPFVICDLEQTHFIKAGYGEMTKKSVVVLIAYGDGTYKYENVQVCVNDKYIAVINQSLNEEGNNFKALENVKTINFLGSAFYFPQQYI